MPKLLLFDIDGTLIDSHGAGGAAILDAAEAYFGVSREDLPPLQLAGATDPAIAMDVFGHLGREHTGAAISAFLGHYLENLHRRLHAPDFSGCMLPGVKVLLDALGEEKSAHLGLLTGNVRRGAEIKLGRHGIFDRFVDGAFGCDHHDRNQLGPIGRRRMQAATGVEYDLKDIIVIGDTPKDIRCAAAFGAKCLAVATGQYSAAELRVHAPWRCVDSLAEVPDMIELLVHS